jgi:predicted transcriptional regulator
LAFAEGLWNIGVNRNVASLITYLKNVNEASSKNIEIATNLRQPEVSIAMRTLREKGWVIEKEVKGIGKGRPLKIYALRSNIYEIINYYEEEKNKESAQTMEAIQRLKELSSA